MDIAQSSNSKAQNKVLVLLQQSLTNLKTLQAMSFFCTTLLFCGWSKALVILLFLFISQNE